MRITPRICGRRIQYDVTLTRMAKRTTDELAEDKGGKVRAVASEVSSIRLR